MGHPKAFELAEPASPRSRRPRLDHVFFTNSGSEAVDTALKIALAYHRARGEGQRTRLIGRERGYHGVGFGGISVGGMVGEPQDVRPAAAGVDHLPHTHDLARATRSRAASPNTARELADELERIVALHDASTIAAVIVEPMAGSTGVLLPPVGLSRAAARDLRPARHPADLRRGDHRLRPARRGVRGGAVRRDPGHDDASPRASPTAPSRWARRSCATSIYDAFMQGPEDVDRAVPRLHLFRPSARLRGGARDARHLSGGRPVRSARASCEDCLGRRGALAEGQPARHRHPQPRPRRRHRARADRGQADQARASRPS